MGSEGGGGASLTCRHCGELASGRYCSSCGAPLSGGPMHFVESLPVVGEPIAFVRTFFRILRSPLEEPVRLVEDPEYRGHFRFLMVGAGIFVAFVLLVFASMRNDGKQPFEPAQASFYDNYLYNLLINYAVGAVIAFVLFRLFGGRNAGVTKHAKLWSILTGFYLPLQMVLLIVIALAGLAAIQLHLGQEANVNTTFAAIGPAFFTIFNVAMALHFAQAHGRVWDTPFWKALLLMVACVVLAGYPASAIQYAFGFVVGLFQGLKTAG